MVIYNIQYKLFSYVIGHLCYRYTEYLHKCQERDRKRKKNVAEKRIEDGLYEK